MNLRGATTYDYANALTNWSTTGALSTSYTVGSSTTFSSLIPYCYAATAASNKGIYIPAAISTKTTNVTMMCRFKLETTQGTGTDYIIFFNGNVSTSGYGFGYANDGAGGVFRVGYGGVAFDTPGGASPARITTGVWYHVALVNNGSSWSFYVNGTSYTLTARTPSAPNSFTSILGYGSSGINYSQGYVTDVVFLDVALSATQIAAYANAPYI